MVYIKSTHTGAHTAGPAPELNGLSRAGFYQPGGCPAKSFLVDIYRGGSFIVLKDFFDIDTETAGYAERKIQARDIFALLDSEDRLPGNTNGLCQVLLRQIVHGPEYLDLILHRCPIPRISGHNKS